MDTTVRLRNSINAAALSTSLLSQKRIWIGPAITALVIFLVGWWANRTVETSIKTNLAGQLKALLDADVAAMEFWITGQQANAKAIAADNEIRTSILKLAELYTKSPIESASAQLLTSSVLGELRADLGPWTASEHIQGFVVVHADMVVLAGDQDVGIGDPAMSKPFQPILEPVLQGDTIFIPPLKSMMVLPDIDGVNRAGIPVMFVATPIRADNDRIVAALCLRIRPEVEFTEILRVARAGKSGETYAFNRQGILITNSRFDDELKQAGLLPDDPSVRSLLNVPLRDPGVDVTGGKRPVQRRSDQSLTQMAVAAVNGESGVNVDGYRDYRGVTVVGAWTWLPRYQIGVATEVDSSEAFQPLRAVRAAFGMLAGLLLMTTLGLCGLTYYASKLDQRVRTATLQAMRLGRYSLVQQIGAGGMGVVYRAHHDMLHRPTAVKLLHVDKTNTSAIARFEREVQLTSQLTHPNTIAIYDYGQTPEGVFYYAMEYLEGMSLEEMVLKFGPLAESRVIFLLRQLCGSLSEAHGLELIHRDIKPANIMLTQCGGMFDFVKLLDFGLAKPQQTDQNVTMTGAITGTPLYLSPEAIQQEPLDARSDLYAVGAVAYFLLAGKPVFEGTSIVDICRQHMQIDPQPISERTGRKIDQDLEQIILRCLAKHPSDRPASAEQLEEELAACRSANEWTRTDAKRWWTDHAAGQTLQFDKETVRDQVTKTIFKSPATEDNNFGP